MANNLHDSFLKILEDRNTDDKVIRIKNLLDQGFSVNELDNHGNTLLHAALQFMIKIKFIMPEIIDFLIKHKANIKIKNAEGKTPISYMVTLYETVKYFSNAGSVVLDLQIPLLTHVILLQLKKSPISDEDVNIIKSNKFFGFVYGKIQKEVDEMDKVIWNDISISSFYRMSSLTLASLTNNSEFVTAFKKIDGLELYPRFSDEVNEMFQKAEKIRDIVNMLTSIFGFYLTEPVIQKIALYLIDENDVACK